MRYQDAIAAVKPRRQKPEDAIQIAVADQLRARAKPGVVWWHTPNGARLGGKFVKAKNGKSFPLQGARLKKFGVRAGVSDILAFFNGEMFCLELKAPDGRPTEGQLEFLSDMKEQGAYGCVAEGLNEAIAVLEAWGLLRGRT